MDVQGDAPLGSKASQVQQALQRGRSPRRVVRDLEQDGMTRQSAIGLVDQALLDSGRIFPGLWQKSRAFAIDSVVIAGLSALGSTVLPPAAAGLVDFLVALAYFTTGFGPLLGGQTFGSRLLGLRVVDRSGAVPQYWQAVLRSVPLAVLLVSPDSWPWATAGSASLLAPIGFGAWVFVLLALPMSVALDYQRRGIHDLMAGTVALRTLESTPGSVQSKVPMRVKIALLPIAAISVASGLAPTLILGAIPNELPAELGLETASPALKSAMSRLGDSVQPLIDKGLLEGFEIATNRIYQPDLGTFVILEGVASVPSGTIGNENREKEIQARLFTELTTLPDIDLVVVALSESRVFGLVKSCSEREFPIPGREEVSKRASTARNMPPPLSLC